MIELTPAARPYALAVLVAGKERKFTPRDVALFTALDTEHLETRHVSFSAWVLMAIEGGPPYQMLEYLQPVKEAGEMDAARTAVQWLLSAHVTFNAMDKALQSLH